MLNLTKDFKNYLQYLPPKDQIYEIDSKLERSIKSNRKEGNLNRKFCIINELKALRHKAIINHIEYIRSTFKWDFLLNHLIIMTSAYLAISFLIQTRLPEKQLKIFWSYLPQEPLKEYLSNADICKGRRNMWKCDLIDMIISGKTKKLHILMKMMN